MIPEFNEQGLLPAGIHRTDLDGFRERFVVFDQSDRRFRVFEQLERLAMASKWVLWRLSTQSVVTGVGSGVKAAKCSCPATVWIPNERTSHSR